ncbi:MBL fold metallo-hydrolase [Patulibacter minatonensis]|uniref:MBL fold metallo-hydrolase n=1 Tax=Patulibacter minatonensis TaxID=298163 RepID=UPI000687AB14|nr:MBL fold metallo-hydrolase [Patulibacter minatonensis]
MALRQLTDRVWVETEHLGSNNGIVSGGDGRLALVDAPHRPTDAIAWAATVAGLGTPEFLVNTDHHPDHTIGNRWLPGTVVAHRLTRSRLVDAAPTRAYLRDLFAVIDPAAVALVDDYEVRLADVTFDERMELFVGDRRLELHHAPGHTANTILVHVPDEGVLFTGDDVCNLGLPAFLDATVERFFDAIEQARALDFEHLVPGHGDPGGRELLDRHRDLGREIVGRVADARDRGDTREDCSDRIRFEDLIHAGVGGDPGYPDDLVEHFQRRSIEQIFDDLETDPSLRDR